MAKNFPYFKFMATDWLAGDIVFQDFETQGFFINVCALYWQKDGILTIEDVEKRYNRNDILLKLEGRFFTKTKRGNITIKFLDEQLFHAGIISKKNSEKGKKSAAAKAAKTKENSTTVEHRLNSVEPNSTNKNKIKNNTKSKEDKEEELEEKKKLFIASLQPHLEEFGKETLNDFYRYWAEANKARDKLKWEMQKTWELKSRLTTWKNNESKFNNGKHQQLTREDKRKQVEDLGRNALNDLLAASNSPNGPDG